MVMATPGMIDNMVQAEPASTTAGFEILPNSTLSSFIDDIPYNNLTFFVVYVLGILLPLSLFIITGNLLVVVAVCNASSSVVFQRATNLFVASLAVADCLVGISLVPSFYLGIFVDGLRSDFYVCLVMTSFLTVSCSISMLHVLCITFDRFLAVMYPLLYHSLMTPRRITGMVIATWSVAIGVGLTPYLGWRKPAKKLQYCYVDEVLSFSYVLFSFILTFGVPLFAMMVLYTRITLAAQRHVRRIAALPAAPATSPCATSASHPVTASVAQCKPVSSGDRKAITTACMVIGVFVMCWLPPYIFNFVMHNRNSRRPAGSDVIRLPLVEVLFNTLAFGNSAANPVIYAFRYKEFRKGIRKILNRVFQRVGVKLCGKGGGSVRERRRDVINLDQITVDPTSVAVGRRENIACVLRN